MATITLLKAVPTAFSAPRSFNQTGDIAMYLTFTNKKTAILEIGIP